MEISFFCFQVLIYRQNTISNLFSEKDLGHVVNITCNIHLCKVYIPMYGKYITSYVANLENRCRLLEPELLVCHSCSNTCQ